MASFRVRVINSMLRLRVKPRLAACLPALEARKIFLGTPMSRPRGVRFTPSALGGVPGEWAEAKATDGPRATLLYLHGGGYIGMSSATHRNLTAAFSSLRRTTALRRNTLSRRQSRTRPRPGGACGARVAGPIYAGGDSAGGGLTRALIMRLRDLGERGPEAACLFSPWTDLAVTGASARKNETRDPLLVASGIHKVAVVYLDAADPRNPFASPLYGDFSGLPPLMFFVGDTEVLLDDSLRAAERARQAGVPVELRLGRDMPHVWPILNRVTPEGRRAMDEAAAFLRSFPERVSRPAVRAVSAATLSPAATRGAIPSS